jgi:hypothetical protein
VIRTLLTRFFVFLGILFFVLLCAGAYVWVADPFEVRPLIRMLWDSDNPERINSPTPSVDEQRAPSTHPALSASQEAALETLGIDPSTLPTTITKEQEACFMQVLGGPRVAEIKAGASPSAAEFFRARTCIQ